MDSVLSFPRSLKPGKGRIKLIKTNQRPQDVDELELQKRVLVGDTAKKLQATNDRLHAEWAEGTIDAEVCDVQSKCSPPFTQCDSTTCTKRFSSGPIRFGLCVLPKADPDPHYSTTKRNESQAPHLALRLV